MDRALKPVLLVFGGAQLALGLGLWLAPKAFYEHVGPYGPRNDHYMADLATFYLALAFAAFVAAVRPAWRLPVLALAAVQYALHTVNHLIDIGNADPSWLGPANFVSLLLTTALLVWLVRLA